MKIAGYVLAVFGALMLISGIHLGFTKYNLHDAHEFNVFIDGLVISFLMLAGGLLLIQRSHRRQPNVRPGRPAEASRPPPMPTTPRTFDEIVDSALQYLQALYPDKPRQDQLPPRVTKYRDRYEVTWVRPKDSGDERPVVVLDRETLLATSARYFL